jgi:AraC-like DNA-binding protein
MIAAATTPFEQALSDLRVSGSILLCESYAAPWAIAIPAENELRALAGADAQTRVMPFHLVRRGSFVLRQRGVADVTVRQGEVVICPGGKPHLMLLGKKPQQIPFREILSDARRPGPGPAALAAKHDVTSLLCGAFFLRSTPLNPLLAALPQVLKIDTGGSAGSPLLSQAAEMLGAEAGRGRAGSFSALRLIEVFCAEALLSYQRQASGNGANWFKALADPRLGPALSRIHEDPGAALSVAELAGLCALSPSRFAARFRDGMGQSVMSYTAQWRMAVACRLLRESSTALASIAAQVGYADVAAFSRAFKSLVGQSPAGWRRQARANS